MIIRFNQADLYKHRYDGWIYLGLCLMLLESLLYFKLRLGGMI